MYVHRRVIPPGAWPPNPELRIESPMRIDIVSDLHLEERKDPSPLGIPVGMFPVYGSVSLPKRVEADVFVIAGDTHPDP
jgi:hypothetical protein